MTRTLDELCHQHERFLMDHPQRQELLMLLLDNSMDADEAEVTADAIIDLMVPDITLKEAV